jgi:hypothetical protein
MDLPPSLSRLLPGEATTDSSLAALVLANIITIVLAIIGNWDLSTVLFIYWAQSVVIGFFAVVTILSADSASLAAEMNGLAAGNPGKKMVWSTRGVTLYKFVMAGFFCVHYGLFHFAYFMFIVEGGLFGPVNLAAGGVWAACGVFFANHLYSFLYNRGREPQGVQSLNAAFFRPYNRIIPMHLTIIFGAFVVLAFGLIGITTLLPVLVLFLALKTYMDVRMHIRKHYEAAHPDEPVMYIGF